MSEFCRESVHEFPRLGLLSWSACFGLLLIGCGSNSNQPSFQKDLVPVTGKVTYQGAALVDAGVTFRPTGDNAVRAAYGRTDEEGNYSLMTPIRDLTPEQSQGAVPGTYRVIISKLSMPDGSAIPFGLTHAEVEQLGAVESIPAKYSSEENSTLTANVVPGGGIAYPAELRIEVITHEQ